LEKKDNKGEMMDKQERENKILEEFHRSGHSEDTFTAFREGWLLGYRARRSEEKNDK